jgi:hypothetical protein
MPASFTYSFFAVLVGAALAGVVLSLRVRTLFDSLVDFCDDMVECCMSVYLIIYNVFSLPQFSIIYALNRALMTMAIDQFP